MPPYGAQESEELGDEVIARLNPQTGEVENLEVPGGEISPQRHREHRADTAGPAPGRGATQLETYVPLLPWPDGTRACVSRSLSAGLCDAVVKGFCPLRVTALCALAGARGAR